MNLPSPNRSHDFVSRIARRIPFYFVVTGSCIVVLAILQYIALDYMPIWNEEDNRMAGYRMTNFATIGQGSIVVTEHLYVDNRVDLPLSLSVSLTNITGTRNQTIHCGTGAKKSVVSPCGRWLATGDERGLVTVIPVDDHKGKTKVQFQSNTGYSDIWWSPNSKVLLVKGEQRCSLYDKDSKGPLASIPLEHEGKISVPCDSECFVVCTEGVYGLFSWETGAKVCDLPVDPQARLVALSSNSKFVASLVGSTVSLYDIELGREVWSNQCRVPWSIKGALCFSPDSETLLVISTKEFSNRTIHLVDTASHQESSFRLPDAMFTGLQFADEESIWLWNNSGTISRWSMSNLDDEFCDDVSCRLVWTRELSEALQ